MNKQQEALSLTRDCDALLIPTAVPIHLPAGSQVLLVQALGGSFTVQINGNLARIEGQDADALGQPVPERQSKNPATGPCDEREVWEQLKTCYDPEIPVNIVDLGLIYKCTINANPEGQGSLVLIEMTLTAPGCGMGPMLIDDITEKVGQVNNVVAVDVQLVFDPPWDKSMMSEVAKLELNMW